LLPITLKIFSLKTIACVVKVQYHGQSVRPPSLMNDMALQMGSLAAELVVAGERL
jgi:hypothetical protein